MQWGRCSEDNLLVQRQVTSELSLKGHRLQRQNLEKVGASWGLSEEPYYEDLINGKEFGI